MIYYVYRVKEEENNMVFKKLKLEQLTEEQQYNGIVAFQMVEISYPTYGGIRTEVFDTKIMADGSQVVIGGNGWVEEGTQIF